MIAPTGYQGPPITTHTWLQPLYRWLKGDLVQLNASGVAVGARIGGALPAVQLGNATGIVGFYGSTGIARPGTGFGITGSASLGSATGTTFFDFRTNGGTGTAYYTLTELVADLKGQGLITP